MGVLTDTLLRERIDQEREPNQLHPGKIGITPYLEECLTPVGYDLRIGREYSVSHRASRYSLEPGESFKVRPRETVFITTLERLTMPSDRSLSGLVLSKVSITAEGLINDTTTVDADWSGNLLLVMHNMSRKAITLAQGQALCTLMFLTNDVPSTKPCQKDSKRNELLLERWSRLNGRVQFRARLRRVGPPLLILASLGLGHLVFKNAPGLIATVAVGVALSQLLREAS